MNPSIMSAITEGIHTKAKRSVEFPIGWMKAEVFYSLVCLEDIVNALLMEGGYHPLRFSQ